MGAKSLTPKSFPRFVDVQVPVGKFAVPHKCVAKAGRLPPC